MSSVELSSTKAGVSAALAATTPDLVHSVVQIVLLVSQKVWEMIDDRPSLHTKSDLLAVGSKVGRVLGESLDVQLPVVSYTRYSCL